MSAPTPTSSASSSRLRPKPLAHALALASSALPIGFGLNCLLNPASALSFFGLAYNPLTAGDKQALDLLLAIYGARDVFMGVALVLAAYYGGRRTTGAVLVAVAAVAGADGAACWAWGTGEEWAHWGYAPLLVALGLYLVV
ncbi:hypothetical protein JCM8097_005941 [Rhodosporidiobolus ruineniae]